MSSEHLLYARCFSKHFNPLTPHNNLMREILLWSPFYREANWGRDEPCPELGRGLQVQLQLQLMVVTRDLVDNSVKSQRFFKRGQSGILCEIFQVLILAFKKK